MEQNYNVITNLFIGITYLFSIILIIDELYNIGFFTFNYTYQFNYGSFTSKFNNIQTIECETSRFNVYNNIKFLYKDIFNKSYFNYLLLIVATLITILCSVAYAVYFYFKFIIEQPLECSFTNETDLSFIKQILKCLCDECHKLIPNCTSNYFIVFVILIIIPLSYIFKTLFNINFTPNSSNALFGFLYICIFILLIFYYSFNLFNRNSENKYKDLIVHSLFTIIFISSGYIYKYIYSKYNNINLNTSNDDATIYDIYKQSPPIKPNPIQKPLYKGSDLLSSFKYDENNKEPDYKIKKTIVDDYYKSIKTYDIDMKNYNIRFNAYNNSLTSTKLGDQTNYFDITIKILGLNNYMHIYLILLIIISLIIYNIYKDDISYVCFIYALTLLIALTIMNSILYYNTYINKYLIYEPMAHYKNDITNANTALNLELNPSSGLVFYNKLINNDKSLMTETNSDVKNGKEILEDIKKLKDIKYYTYDNTSNINKDITNYNTYISSSSSLLTNIDKNIDNPIFVFNNSSIIGKSQLNCTTKMTGPEGGAQIESTDVCYLIYKNPLEYLLKDLGFIKSAFNNYIKIETEKTLVFKYSLKDIYVKIPMSGYYKYCYYMLYQYQYLLENRIDTDIKNVNIIKINEKKDIINNLMRKLNIYKGFDAASQDTNIKNNIKKQLDIITINTLEGAANTYLFNKIDDFITNNIKNINLDILDNSQQTMKSDANFLNNKYIMYLSATNNAISDSNYYIVHNTEIAVAISTLNAPTMYTYTNCVMYNDAKYKYTFMTDTTNLFKRPNYFELPSKISDNNDEYILTFKTAALGNIKHDYIFLHYELISEDKIENYSYNSKYTNRNLKYKPILSIADKNNIFNLSLIEADLKNQLISIPFVLIKKNNNNKIELFKKIILAVLFNGICNIQSKFENKELFDKIKIYKTPVIEFQLNKIYIMPYTASFLEDFITLDNKADAKILLNNTDNYISFYILLFNAYHSAFIDIKKTINTNINYLMNNSKKIITTTTIINILDDIINYNLLSDEKINSDNSDFNKDDDIIKLYNNNKPIINLIIALFENLLITIKTTINKSLSYSSLCYPPSTSRLIIQDAINKKFDAITPGSASATTYNTISKALDPANDVPTRTLIDELNNILRYYFNIVIFLLDNLKLNTNTAEIDVITNNFNFYNRDDNIKNIIQKQLIINCDYYSKYNNMDSKQLSYFKINADNVNYNFPILMIIFLIILGEPIFIKS
jgi:hypothetical protein